MFQKVNTTKSARIRRKMKKYIVIGAIIIATIAGIICLSVFRANPFANMDPDLVHGPSEQTGHITEKTVGEGTKLIIFEYADFGCSHCAEWNRKINKLMDKYNGNITLVFRNYNLGFANSSAAARAATAASIQRYFKEYKDLLFENQAEWFYEEGSKLSDIFVKYFEQASDNSGDVDKFKKDMKSDPVRTHLKFEQEMGKKIDLAGTPTFRIDGETINLSELERTIEQKLGR